MNEVTFVLVRNDEGVIYDSYTDFYNLVELSDFKTCELDDIKEPGTYIFPVDNGNVKECLMAKDRSKYKFILWYLERGTPPNYYDEIWVSDRWFAKQLKVKYVPLGGHRDLSYANSFGVLPLDNKLYDFIPLSYLYGERLNKVEQLKENYTIAPNGWGEERDFNLSASRYGLCLHQDDQPIIEPLRYTLFACCKLPIVAEYSEDYDPYRVIPFENFIDLNDRSDLVRDNYLKMTEELTFKKCVEDNL